MQGISGSCHSCLSVRPTHTKGIILPCILYRFIFLFFIVFFLFILLIDFVLLPCFLMCLHTINVTNPKHSQKQNKTKHNKTTIKIKKKTKIIRTLCSTNARILHITIGGKIFIHPR